MMILECPAYQKLLSDVERDEGKAELQRPGTTDNRYRQKLQWILDRAAHYADLLDVPAEAVLTKWEENRKSWYMNYYQDANQPLLTGGKVRVFATMQQLKDSIGNQGFRCPHCKGVSTSPYECNSGVQLPLINSGGKAEACNWKIGGLFRDLGRGVSVFVKEVMEGELLFKPVAWEEKP